MKPQPWNTIDGVHITHEDIEAWQQLPVTRLMRQLVISEHLAASGSRDAAETPNDKVNFYRGKCVGLSTQINIEMSAIKRLQDDAAKKEKEKTDA